MMPRSLREEGLVIAIQELLNRLFKNTKIKISFETYGIEGRLPDTIENGIFRIIQELTANIIKHSQAEIVTIQLLKADSHLVLVVEDDGIGIKEKASGSGIGWKNINARVSAMNGSCFIENGKEKGVTVAVKIPFINS
jgi:two-component system NarL family sensor kinase